MNNNNEDYKDYVSAAYVEYATQDLDIYVAASRTENERNDVYETYINYNSSNT